MYGYSSTKYLSDAEVLRENPVIKSWPSNMNNIGDRTRNDILKLEREYDCVIIKHRTCWHAVFNSGGFTKAPSFKKLAEQIRRVA